MTKQNFLLGKGERLTEGVMIKSGGGPKVPPYTFEEARERLTPMLGSAAKLLSALPEAACPDDRAIVSLTLNPEYIAKSYYPSGLFHATGLEAVGSRPRKIKPEKRSRDREPEEKQTTEMFLMGLRSSFRRWANSIQDWRPDFEGANDLASIEMLTVPTPSEKLLHVKDDSESMLFEIVMHVDEGQGENYYLPKFKEYLESIGLQPPLDKRFYVDGLCFLELEAPIQKAEEIATFSFVRVMRPMPPLRMLRPIIRATGIAQESVSLPENGPLANDFHVAIFDGGIPDDHAVTAWANPIDAPGVGPTNNELLKHGVGVTSALLFGHLEPDQLAPQPYAPIDHYRVLDTEPGEDPYELYKVLDRIQNVLSSSTKKYNFINLSLGPELPIDDSEVHAWTAVLDTHLSDGQCLATIAVGNGGEGDSAIEANRIQVPADCVNAVCVGATDTPDKTWERAVYSSIGPGRSPGLIKPDLVDFGGSMKRPFLVLHSEDAPLLEPTGGTSFSAPSVLRLGVGVRAHFGNALSALAIRGLLIHSAESAPIPHKEIGWGRAARSVDNIVLCDDDSIRVVYQGSIRASKYLRASIPIPNEQLTGKVSIKATLCFATEVDPHHTGNYTRASLEPVFRPNKDKRKKPDDPHPVSKSFFSKDRPGMTEQELRSDAWKWENCCHAEHKFHGRTLKGPVFDIHYNARYESHNDKRSQQLRYALIMGLS